MENVYFIFWFLCFMCLLFSPLPTIGHLFCTLVLYWNFPSQCIDSISCITSHIYCCVSAVSGESILLLNNTCLAVVAHPNVNKVVMNDAQKSSNEVQTKNLVLLLCALEVSENIILVNYLNCFYRKLIASKFWIKFKYSTRSLKA